MGSIPVAAGSSHTKTLKMGVVPACNGTHIEVGTTKRNWSALCQ